MLVRFWGTRGSIPTSQNAATVRDRLRQVLKAAAGRTLADDAEIDRFLSEDLPFPLSHTFGGNSSCVEIETGTGEYVLCDLGSGVRAFGETVMARHGPQDPQTYHIFMSHLHWDHILGFPFFVPAYIPGNRIRIYSGHAEVESAFVRQQDRPSFPVPLAAMGADLEFVVLETGCAYDIAGMTVSLKRQYHPGDSYGYRFENDGKAVVYSTDSEHKQDDPAQTIEFVDFFKDADLVIFDAMYTLADAFTAKEDWGHSSNFVGVELCQAARAKELCLFHHDPAGSDEALFRQFQDTVKLEEVLRQDHAVRVSAAYDGLEIAV